jgi:hypothetical protein
MEHFMLTTKDNPFSPITEYDEWLTWDLAQGYCTNSLLARVIHTSPDLSDADQDEEIQNAISEIVQENVSGMHTMVLVQPTVLNQPTSS